VIAPTVCDRYVTPEPAQTEREFRVVRPWWKFSPSFNVCPSSYVPVVRKYDDEVEGVMLHWGLIPDWAEADASKGCAASVSAALIERSAVTRGPWKRATRCIVPMFGFYVWQPTRARYRQPFFVRRVNRSVFGVAALWDRTTPERGEDVIESFALLTVPANPLLAELQDPMAQMPAILERKDYDTWLGAPAVAARAVLRTCAHDQMLAHAVSPRINSAGCDDAQLIQAVEPFMRVG
jgi:putative SOS response-associated peptidase YedK